MRFFLFILAVIACIPATTFASTVVRTGETVSLTADQAVEGDFYGLGGTVAVSGEVTEDLLIAAGTVTVNGQVGADLMVVGGTVDLHGTIADDVRVIGGTVTVAGTINGNLVVVGSELVVLSTATINGDLLFFGGSADISGNVGQDVIGTSESLRVDAAVGGDLDVKTVSLTLGDRTEVAGTVSYTSAKEVVRSQNAVVKGQVVRSTEAEENESGARTAVIAFLITLFASLVVYLLLKRFTLKVVASAQQNYWRALLSGFGVIFLLPIAAVILFVSTLGGILGLLLIASYVVVLTLTLTLLGAVAGTYMWQLLRQRTELSVLGIVVGVAVVHLLVYIPIVGPLVLVVLATLTLGAVVLQIISLFRSA